MKSNLITQFNLPSYIKGKTFSDASKAIDKKFEGRNDKVSLETKEALLQRLSEAQEYVKMQQGMQNESQQVPDQMNGQIPEGMEEYAQGQQPQIPQNDVPQGMEEYAGGGFMEQSKAAFQADGAGPTGAIVGGLGTALDIGKTMFGNPNVDTSGAVNVEKKSGAMDALSLGAKGAATGATIGGPLGAAIGGVVGAGAGLIGANKHNKEAALANHNFTLAQNSNLREGDFAYGGSLKNKFALGGGPDKSNYDAEVDNQNLKQQMTQRPAYNPVTANPLKASPITTDTQKILASADPLKALKDYTTTVKPVDVEQAKGLDWSKVGNVAANAMQYAPVASNLLDLKNLSKANTERGTRLDNVYKPNLLDESRYINQLNQQNTQRALTESSGGDLGALRSNLLAADINKKKAMSDVMSKADDVNRGEDRFAYQTGMQKDMFNTNLDQDFINRKAQDEAAYESTKGSLKRQLAEDIGAIGKEEVDKKLVKELFGYKWNGKYWIDKEGKKHSNKDVATKLKSEKED